MVMHILTTQQMSKKTEISEELFQYALDYGMREHPVLTKLRHETAKLTNSIMQIPQEQGQFMALLAKSINAKRYLELGVFTGYSSLVMALAIGKDGTVTALDNNPEYVKVAQQFWDEAGVSKQINLINGNALDTCEELLNSNHANYFDIAFIDANKSDYLAYYEYCYQLVRPGGLILIDNVLFKGQVLDEKPSTSTKAIKQLNEFVLKDQRVEISLLPIADGLTIAYKKELK